MFCKVRGLHPKIHSAFPSLALPPKKRKQIKKKMPPTMQPPFPKYQRRGCCSRSCVRRRLATPFSPISLGRESAISTRGAARQRREGRRARVPKEHPLFLLLFIPGGSASAAGGAAPSRAPARRGNGHRRGGSFSAGFSSEFPGAPHQNRRRGPRSPVQPPPPAAAAQAHSKENNT